MLPSYSAQERQEKTRLAHSLALISVYCSRKLLFGLNLSKKKAFRETLNNIPSFRFKYLSATCNGVSLGFTGFLLPKNPKPGSTKQQKASLRFFSFLHSTLAWAQRRIAKHIKPRARIKSLTRSIPCWSTTQSGGGKRRQGREEKNEEERKTWKSCCSWEKWVMNQFKFFLMLLYSLCSPGEIEQIFNIFFIIETSSRLLLLQACAASFPLLFFFLSPFFRLSWMVIAAMCWDFRKRKTKQTRMAVPSSARFFVDAPMRNFLLSKAKFYFVEKTFYITNVRTLVRWSEWAPEVSRHSLRVLG